MRWMIAWGGLLLAWLLLNAVHVSAQASAPVTEAENLLQLDQPRTGRLDDGQPRQRYRFEGQRGDVLRVRLTTEDDDLDPVLTLLDPAGRVLLHRDDDASPGEIVATLTLEANATYVVLVGRFGYEVGSTSGDYTLTLERLGVLSNQGSTLRYGDSVINTISHANAQTYYTFQAEAGDIVNIHMARSSGNLDAYLQVVDRGGFVLADNDDIPGSGTKNARIDGLLIEETGLYVIVATRYGQVSGESTGSFILTLNEARNSGLGNSRLAPAPLSFDQPVENAISDDTYERYYRFQGQRDDLMTVTMDQIGGLLDAYLILADAQQNPLAIDDDSGAGRNARIDRYRLPRDGTYILIATRFERANGSTTGRYRLRIRREGNAFDGVPLDIPRMIYGTTVTGRIDDADTQRDYAFWGRAGDAITIALTRADGNLDPVLELRDVNGERILRDDDGGEGQNSRIERYSLPYTGVYLIRALRYEGNNGPSDTTGSYLLTLARLPGEN